MYPFERFSEDSKAVLTLAQAEAERAGHSYIGTEHLLVGLMQRQQGMAAIALTNLGIQYEEVQRAIENVMKRTDAERMQIQQIIPTSRVKRVIEMAFAEAHREQFGRVETGHLLFGLLLDGEGIAAHVLKDRGVTVERVRTEIARLRTAGKAEGMGPGPAPTRRHLALTDGSGRPIAVDILFPAGYSPAEQDTLALRIHEAVEKGGTA